MKHVSRYRGNRIVGLYGHKGTPRVSTNARTDGFAKMLPQTGTPVLDVGGCEPDQPCC